MKRTQYISHYGSGDIIQDSTINIGTRVHGAEATSIEKLINQARQQVPDTLSTEEKADIETSLDDIESAQKEANVEKRNSKIRRAIETLVGISSKVAATTSFAAAVTDIIRFFSEK